MTKFTCPPARARAAAAILALALAGGIAAVAVSVVPSPAATHARDTRETATLGTIGSAGRGGFPDGVTLYAIQKGDSRKVGDFYHTFNGDVPALNGGM